MSRWDHYGRSSTDGRETSRGVETDGGPAEASSDTSGIASAESSSEEAKLRAYDTLRDEILSAVDRQVTLNTRGVGAMILIVGYSINFDQLAVLAFLPVILSYLLVRTAESRAWMTNAGGQIAKIEQAIATDPSEDSFGFEHQLGGFGSEDISGVRRLRDVPAMIRILFVAAVYAVVVFGVLYVVWPLDEIPRLLNVRITRDFLATVYVALTGFVLISAASVGLFTISLQRQILTVFESQDE